MLAIKRLDKANIPETEGRGKNPQQVAKYAKSLVRWFKNYRDFVVQGAWYPDAVLCDQGSSHGRKIKHDTISMEMQEFHPLPDTMEVYQAMKLSSLYEEPFIVTGNNVNERCEAMCHTMVDNFKIQFCEEKGNPIIPASTHMAMRFFMLSHYIADSHMPMHCDDRSLKGLHDAFEDKWENDVFASYYIDEDNERFFYDRDGFPLLREQEEITDLIKAVEEKIVTRPFVFSWGSSGYNCRQYIEAVTEYSYLLGHEMVPEECESLTWGKYKKHERYQSFNKYSAMLLADAVDSIARAWLHVWIRYRDWGPDKDKNYHDNYM